MNSLYEEMGRIDPQIRDEVLSSLQLKPEEIDGSLSIEDRDYPFDLSNKVC